MNWGKVCLLSVALYVHSMYIYTDTTLAITILSHGIDYFLKEITITSQFRLSLRFQKNLIVLVGNRYNKSSVSRRTQYFQEEQHENRNNDHEE